MKAPSSTGASALLFGSSALALLTLTGCPLSDDYSIDPNYGSSGGANSGGHSNARGGATSAGAGASGGVSAASGESGSTTDCSPGTCSGACCGSTCVDLRSDGSNCGRCGNVCSVGRACSVGSCTPGWTAMAAPPTAFVAREKAAYAAFSDKVFVWGGVDTNGNELRSGAIYDPALDVWQNVAIDANTPSARELATAVWTGSAVLVFGGRNSGGDVALKDAALYDPVANRWTKVAENPTARVAPIAAAYSGSALFWSGLSANLIPLAGADRYRVSMDMWAAATGMNAPPRLGHTACALVGGFFYVYGGIDAMITVTDKTYAYNFAMNTWSILARGPSARWDAFGASDGTRFYVWGGRDSEAVHADGSGYDAQWVTMGASGAPLARYAPLRESGWSFSLDGSGFIVLGGFDSEGAMLHDGGRYTTASDDWSSIPAWPSGEDHGFGVSVRAGNELVVFGGHDGTSLSNTGERYAL